MLRDTLAQKWEQIQGSLFSWIVEEIGEISEKQQQLISILELLRVEEYTLSSNALVGRYCGPHCQDNSIKKQDIKYPLLFLLSCSQF